MFSDITKVISTWDERVAFNSGYEKQRIATAQQAGRDAYDMGMSRTDGRLDYFESINQEEQNEQLALEHSDDLRTVEPVELMASEGVPDDALFADSEDDGLYSFKTNDDDGFRYGQSEEDFNYLKELENQWAIEDARGY